MARDSMACLLGRTPLTAGCRGSPRTAASEMPKRRRPAASTMARARPMALRTSGGSETGSATAMDLWKPRDSPRWAMESRSARWNSRPGASGATERRSDAGCAWSLDELRKGLFRGGYARRDLRTTTVRDGLTGIWETYSPPQLPRRCNARQLPPACPFLDLVKILGESSPWSDSVAISKGDEAVGSD